MSGAELKELRESMGFTQLKLADELEVTTRTVSRLEQKRRIPKLYRLALQALSGPAQGQTRRKSASR